MLQENISIHSNSAVTGSEAVRLGDFIYISGILPLDEQNHLIDGNVQDQIEQVLKNMGQLLKKCDLDYRHVLKLGIQLTDLNNVSYVNDAVHRIFCDPYPACTVTGVASLCLHASVQMDGIAVDTRALEVLCSGEDDDDNGCCGGSYCTFQ